MSVAVLVMELSVISLLLGWVWVAIAGSPWPAPWIILLAAPFGLVAGRNVPYSWRRRSWFDGVWWAIVAVVVALLAEAGNAFWPGVSSGARWNVQFVAGLLVAWRAWSLADGWIDRELVESELQVGMLVVLGMLLMLIWVVPGAGLLAGVTFAAAGLVGLGLARRAERRDPRASLETDWLVLVGGMVVLIVGVAGLVVALITPDVLLALYEQAQGAALLALTGIGALLQWIGSLLPGAGTPPEQAPSGGPSGGPMSGVATLTPTTTIAAPQPWLLELVLTFVGVVFLFFAVRAMVRLMRINLRGVDLALPRLREPGPPVSAADRFTWAGWWRLVLAWLRAWLRGGGTSSARDGRSAAPARTQVAEQRSIRALYREFLSAVARAGFERHPATTPNELAREVNAARPAATRAIQTITDLYVRARYGEEHVGRDDLSRMRTAVQQIRHDLTNTASREASPGREGAGGPARR